MLFLCAGSAGLGLLTGGDHPPASALRDPLARYFPPGMPRYPKARELPAGDSRIGGASVRMAYFTSEDEPAKIGDYYASFWRSRRLQVREDVTHRGGVVSAVDVERDQIYQVMLVTRGDRTAVFPSVTTAPNLVLQQGAAPPVPLFPESKTLLSSSTKAGPNAARILLTVNGGTLEENLAHYRRELAAAGYVPEKRRGAPAAKLPGGESHRILLFRNGAGGEITINMTALGEKRTRVHITAVGVK